MGFQCDKSVFFYVYIYKGLGKVYYRVSENEPVGRNRVEEKNKEKNYCRAKPTGIEIGFIMPSPSGYKRNYKQEYATARARGEVDAGPDGANAKRKKARRIMESKGRVKRGDGKDVDHKNRNPKDNSPSNLRVTTKKNNRSFDRVGASRPAKNR